MLITVLMIAIGGVYLYSIFQPTVNPLVAVGWLLVAIGLALASYSAFNWFSNRQPAV